MAILVKKGVGDIIVRYELQPHKTCNCDKCNFKTLWVELQTKRLNYVIGAIYRHPDGDTGHFTEDLKSTLDKLSDKDACILLGDTNIDLLQYENSTYQNTSQH